MPPEMPQEDKDAWAERYPTDPHRAAGEAWEAWAATLPVTATVTSVSTGDQSVTYKDGVSEYDAAVQRAEWHLARANVRSVALVSGPSLVYGALGAHDPEDRGTILTYDAGTIPLNSPVTGGQP